MGSEVESLSLVSLLRHITAQRDCHSHNTAGPRHHRNMDLDRVQDRGSLLNKVYETQCLMDMKMEERKPEQVLSVAGGRMVFQAAPSPYPLTGQQLMMQLDNLTSGITSMSVQEEPMEEEDSTTEQVGQGVQGPFCQEEKRRDPVYIASLAAHSLPLLNHSQHLHQEHPQSQPSQDLSHIQLQIVSHLGTQNNFPHHGNMLHEEPMNKGILKRANILPMDSFLH